MVWQMVLVNKIINAARENREVAVNFDIISVNRRLKGFNCARSWTSRFTVNTNDNLKNSGKDFPFTSQKVLPIFLLNIFACYDKLVSYTFSQSNQIKFFISKGSWSPFVKVAESEYRKYRKVKFISFGHRQPTPSPKQVSM